MARLHTVILSDFSDVIASHIQDVRCDSVVERSCGLMAVPGVKVAVCVNVSTERRLKYALD